MSERWELMGTLWKQILSFSFVGVLATVIDYALFALMYNGLSMHYLLATTIAFIGATLFNYWASMRYVFTSKYGAHERKKEFTSFFILSVLGLGLTTLLMKVTVTYLAIYPNLAKLAVTAIVMVFNFVSRKLVLEERKAHD